MYTKKEREYYNIQRNRTCEDLNINVAVYNHFRRIGEDLHRLYEMSCNGEISDEQYETRTNAFYVAADNLAKGLGLHIFYQTDPRGATIYLDNKPIENNSYTNAYCVY